MTTLFGSLTSLFFCRNPKNKGEAKKTKAAATGQFYGNGFKKIFKPFEKNVHRGWGKKVLPSTVFSTFEFVGSDHDDRVIKKCKHQESVVETLNETTWTNQKIKKERIKKEYKVKKSSKHRGREVHEEIKQLQIESFEEIAYSSPERNDKYLVEKAEIKVRKYCKNKSKEIHSADESEQQSEQKEEKKMKKDYKNKNKEIYQEVQQSQMTNSDENKLSSEESDQCLGKQKKARLFYGIQGKRSKKGNCKSYQHKEAKKAKYIKRSKLCEMVGISHLSSSQDSQDYAATKPKKKKRSSKKDKYTIPANDICLTESSSDLLKQKPVKHPKKRNNGDLKNYNFRTLKNGDTAISKKRGRKNEGNTEKHFSGYNMEVDEQSKDCTRINYDICPNESSQEVSDKVEPMKKRYCKESGKDIVNNQKNYSPESDNTVALEKQEEKKKDKKTHSNDCNMEIDESVEDLALKAEQLISGIFANKKTKKYKKDKNKFELDKDFDSHTKVVTTVKDNYNNVYGTAEMNKEEESPLTGNRDVVPPEKKKRLKEVKPNKKGNVQKDDYLQNLEIESSNKSTSASVDASQEPLVFIETPPDIIKKKDMRKSLEQVFQNIEAISNKKQVRNLIQLRTLFYCVF